MSKSLNVLLKAKHFEIAGESDTRKIVKNFEKKEIA
jgi:hypothetical protein